MNRNKKNLSGTSGFLAVFGKSDKAKVLNFFLENKIFRHTVEETHKATGISTKKLEKIFRFFFRIGILDFNSLDKSQFYTFGENDLTKYLIMIDGAITRFDADLNSELKELV